MSRPESRPPLRVAVAGLGHVGSETVRLLRSCGAGKDAEARLTAVCDRRVQSRADRLGLPKSVARVADCRRLLSDPDIDAVVELFGGVRTARPLVLGALRAGKHVVTANKHLMAEHWREISQAAARSGAALRFEAAVAGGIPILQAVRSGLAANRIESVCGILNGTTNFILSRMARTGCEMEQALKEAQRLGMAEADPSKDIDGTDSAHKVSILASLLTGGWVPPSRIPKHGIAGLQAEDIRFGKQRLSCAVRLIGTARTHGRSPGVEAHVQPTFVPLNHPLAAVHDGYNAVLVQASSAGDLMFYGQGAGPGPAASAVVADILSIGRDRLRGPRVERPAPGPIAVVSAAAESPASYYLKFRVRDVPGALSKISGMLSRCGISISSIHQERAPGGGRSVPVMITTHPAARAHLDRARAAITALRPVSKAHSCIRILQA